MKINIKSKKFIILFSIIFIILIFTITLISVLVMRSEHTGLLYYESQLNFNGSYTTSELSAQYNGGNNIRAWFNNYSKQDVNVTIIRCGLLGEQVALTFSVDAGGQHYVDYYDRRAGSYKYKVMLESADMTDGKGNDIISGELRVRQL